MNNQSLWSDAYRRLINNKAAVISACILAILILAAIFAPFLATHSYAYQNLELGATPPSTEYLLCLLYTSPSPRDRTRSRMPSSA